MDWLPIALSVLVALAYGSLAWYALRVASSAHRLPPEQQLAARFGRPLGGLAAVSALGVLVGMKYEVVALIASGLLAITAAALFVLQFRARAPWTAIALIAGAFLLACFHLGFHD